MDGETLCLTGKVTDCWQPVDGAQENASFYLKDLSIEPVNSIIQQRACLPTQSGKVEEGALVDLTDYSMRLLEKKYDIDGHKEFYLSTVVFQYTTAQPEKKKLQARSS